VVGSKVPFCEFTLFSLPETDKFVRRAERRLAMATATHAVHPTRSSR
jgi:hypothetical protein